MKIELINVEGFVPAIMALRLPHNGKCQSMIYEHKSKLQSFGDKFNYEHFESSEVIDISKKDIALLKALRTKGDSDAKVLRGIRAWFQVTAPRYWWQEMATYEVGVTKLGSNSTMHTQAKGLKGKELQEVKGDIKERTENTRIFAMSYQTLTKVVRERKGHRLPEWAEFLDVVYSLPYYKELIEPIDHKAIIKSQMLTRSHKAFCDAKCGEGFYGYCVGCEMLHKFIKAMEGDNNGNN